MNEIFDDWKGRFISGAVLTIITAELLKFDSENLIIDFSDPIQLRMANVVYLCSFVVGFMFSTPKGIFSALIAFIPALYVAVPVLIVNCLFLYITADSFSIHSASALYVFNIAWVLSFIYIVLLMDDHRSPLKFINFPEKVIANPWVKLVVAFSGVLSLGITIWQLLIASECY